MPAYRARYDILHGPTVPILVRDTASGRQLRYDALLDTGAQMTCISKGVALDLQLEIQGNVIMYTSLHRSYTPTYFVETYLACAEGDTPLGQISVATFVARPNAPYDVVLGRDIIRQGALHLEPSGEFTFSV